jgi:hypothetical protein
LFFVVRQNRNDWLHASVNNFVAVDAPNFKNSEQESTHRHNRFNQNELEATTEIHNVQQVVESGSGPAGRWFKSTRPDHQFQRLHSDLRSFHHPAVDELVEGPSTVSARGEDALGASLILISHQNICDRVGSCVEKFHEATRRLEVQLLLPTAQSPWQNAYVERRIGSIRRESLD